MPSPALVDQQQEAIGFWYSARNNRGGRYQLRNSGDAARDHDQRRVRLLLSRRDCPAADVRAHRNPEEDKKWVVFPGSHSVPKEDLVRETLDWLDRYLGPVS